MSARTLLLIVVILLAAFSRLIQHPANFAPVCALAFFGGMQFKSRWAAFLVPLSAMLLSDVALELFTRLDLLSGWMKQGQGFYPDMPFVYLGVALVALLGLVLQKWKSVPTIVGGILGSSLLYFLITNFGSWLMSPFYEPTDSWTPYPRTFAGLIECYIMGIPFYKASLLGDVIFGYMFAGWALLERLAPGMERQLASRGA